MAERPFETRTVTAQVEYRDDEQGPTIIGHAATFNQPYRVGHFEETIHPDAFRNTLKTGPDVRLLIDHEGQPLARTKSGTLELGTDEHGLTVRATLDPTDPDVQRLLPKLRRGDMDQMSFAFRVPKGGDTWDHSGDMSKRTIREAILSGGDVSIVTYPANENATVALRQRESREAHFTYLQALVDEMRDGRKVDSGQLAKAIRAVHGVDDDTADDRVAGYYKLDEEPLAVDERASKEPYGDVDYADPGYQKDGKKRYPLDSEEHVRAAWDYIHVAANQEPYTADQVSNIMGRIRAAAPKFGIQLSEANSGIPTDLAQRILRARALRRSA
jgi:HK97 family phage prohead protease